MKNKYFALLVVILLIGCLPKKEEIKNIRGKYSISIDDKILQEKYISAMDCIKKNKPIFDQNNDNELYTWQNGDLGGGISVISKNKKIIFSSNSLEPASWDKIARRKSSGNTKFSYLHF